jgi:hypothetical protein
MRIIKLEFDFLIGPIVKDVFSASSKKLITGVDVIDNDLELNELNEQACELYSSLYDFDGDKACGFNLDRAKTEKSNLQSLLEKIVQRLNFINDGSYEVENIAKSQLESL